MKNNKKYTNDEQLELIREQNSQMLHYLYNESFKSIKRMVLTNSGSEEDAFDVFQEAITVLYLKSKDASFHLSSDIKTYLYSVSHRFWLRTLRRRKNAPLTLDNEALYSIEIQEEIEDIFVLNERKRLFKEKFEELTNDCRKVIELFLQGYSVKEVAVAMDYSTEQHAKNRHYRCKKTLIKKIKESENYKQLGHG